MTAVLFRDSAVVLMPHTTDVIALKNPKCLIVVIIISKRLCHSTLKHKKSNLLEMTGVRIPSPITTKVPSMAISNRRYLAVLLFSSLDLTVEARWSRWLGT